MALPDVELRLLRQFVAVAEELHFTRAAARLFIAQQALSRNIARLERDLGVTLFERSTRNVTLTADGERLLPMAQELLTRHDELLASVRPEARALVVDVVAAGSTPARIVAETRRRLGDTAVDARYHGGLAAALDGLRARRVDVAFGRGTSPRLSLPDDLAPPRLVRFEPLGLLVADDDPLAALDAIPLGALGGRTIDTSGGNVAAPEWEELAGALVTEHGGTVAPDHHPGMAAVAAAPPEAVADHVRATGWPIVTFLERTAVPGVVTRPLVDPVPVYPWQLLHRGALEHPALDALLDVAAELAGAEGWLDVPAGAWLAPADRGLRPAG